MKADLCRNLARIKISGHGVRNHALKLGKRVTLCGDTAAARIIPPGHKAAGLGAGFDSEDNFHGPESSPTVTKRQPSLCRPPSSHKNLPFVDRIEKLMTTFGKIGPHRVVVSSDFLHTLLEADPAKGFLRHPNTFGGRKAARLRIGSRCALFRTTRNSIKPPLFRESL